MLLALHGLNASNRKNTTAAATLAINLPKLTVGKRPYGVPLTPEGLSGMNQAMEPGQGWKPTFFHQDLIKEMRN